MIEQELAAYLDYCECHYLRPQDFDNLNFYLNERKEQTNNTKKENH